MSPSAGKEQKGQLPALRLSAFAFNRATGFCFFAPIATVGNATRGTSFAVHLQGAGTAVTGVIQIDQIRSFDWRERGGKRSGDVVPDEILLEVLDRFAPVLGLGVLEGDG